MQAVAYQRTAGIDGVAQLINAAVSRQGTGWLVARPLCPFTLGDWRLDQHGADTLLELIRQVTTFMRNTPIMMIYIPHNAKFEHGMLDAGRTLQHHFAGRMLAADTQTCIASCTPVRRSSWQGWDNAKLQSQPIAVI